HPAGPGGTGWFLAMEYMAGGSLRDLLARGRGPLEAARVVRYALDVAEALAAASGEGWVHHHIAPSCILFDAAGTAKLGGFSERIRGASGPGGQPVPAAGRVDERDSLYQAPEQVGGQGLQGPSSDLS